MPPIPKHEKGAAETYIQQAIDVLGHERVGYNGGTHYETRDPVTGRRWGWALSPRSELSWFNTLRNAFRDRGVIYQTPTKPKTTAEERRERDRRRRELDRERAERARERDRREREIVKREVESRGKYAALWDEVARRSVDGEQLDRLMRERPGA